MLAGLERMSVRPRASEEYLVMLVVRTSQARAKASRSLTKLDLTWSSQKHQAGLAFNRSELRARHTERANPIWATGSLHWKPARLLAGIQQNFRGPNYTKSGLAWLETALAYSDPWQGLPPWPHRSPLKLRMVEVVEGMRAAAGTAAVSW